jgi:phenylalanyl-tRNA synthetase beta subunit
LYGKNGRASGGTGFDSTDLSVMREFLNYANSKGLTIDAALPTLLSEVKPVVGTGKVIRTTAKQDIRSVFQDTTQKILGRNVSAAEIEKFVKAFEGMEIKEGGGGVKAPNIRVAAEQQVQQQFGPEAQAVGALGLFDILDKKIKGQA